MRISARMLPPSWPAKWRPTTRLGAPARESKAVKSAATGAAASCARERLNSGDVAMAPVLPFGFLSSYRYPDMRANADHRHIRSCSASAFSWLLAILMLLRPTAGALVDLTLFGGAFDSSSTIAYSEVVQTCFGGLEVGSCQPSSPNWLTDYLDQYNQLTSGIYCAACCSNTDASGDTWTFTCPLASAAFVQFINYFGWEFRFGRRENLDDRGVITCPIPRKACTYNENGSLAVPCQSDGSFLSGYVLSIEVMTVERGLRSWKSVQGCSVTTEESVTQPVELSETIAMTQVYAGDSGIEAGWATLIALVALFILSCAIRYARDDRCIICGHHLIWFRRVCLPCNFFGYVAPSKEVAEIMQDKRAVVLPEPTLSERIGTLKASTKKVFIQAAEGILPTGTMSKISSIRNGTLWNKPMEGGGESRVGTTGSADEALRTMGGGSADEIGASRPKGRVSAISGARSVIFVDDIMDEKPYRLPVHKKSKSRPGKHYSGAVAPQVAMPGGESLSGNSEEKTSQGASAGSKPRPLKRSSE